MRKLLSPPDEDRDDGPPPQGDPDNSDGAPVARNLFEPPEHLRIPDGVRVEADWRGGWVGCVMKGSTLCLTGNRGHAPKDAVVWVTADDDTTTAADAYAARLRRVLGFRRACAGER
jgi:hypothetical protein